MKEKNLTIVGIFLFYNFMSSNEELVQSFMESFQKRNAKAMWSHYHEDATFQDPVFGELKGKEILAMWSMLLEGMGEDSEIRWSPPQQKGELVICRWEAIYPFAKTKRRIHNKIQSQFFFQDGKIAKQIDSFSLYRWIRMAFGWKGLWFGWTPGFQAKVREETKKSLMLYKKRRRIE